MSKGCVKECGGRKVAGGKHEVKTRGNGNPRRNPTKAAAAAAAAANNCIRKCQSTNKSRVSANIFWTRDQFKSRTRDQFNSI